MEFTSNEAKLDLCSIPLLYFSLQTLKRIEKGSPNESNKNELNSHFEVFSNKKNEVKKTLIIIMKGFTQRLQFNFNFLINRLNPQATAISKYFHTLPCQKKVRELPMDKLYRRKNTFSHQGDAEK